MIVKSVLNACIGALDAIGRSIFVSEATANFFCVDINHSESVTVKTNVGIRVEKSTLRINSSDECELTKISIKILYTKQRL